MGAWQWWHWWHWCTEATILRWKTKSYLAEVVEAVEAMQGCAIRITSADFGNTFFGQVDSRYSFDSKKTSLSSSSAYVCAGDEMR